MHRMGELAQDVRIAGTPGLPAPIPLRLLARTHRPDRRPRRASEAVLPRGRGKEERPAPEGLHGAATWTDAHAPVVMACRAAGPASGGRSAWRGQGGVLCCA